MRGFGFLFENGRVRNWYCADDGVQRWADTDEPVAPVIPLSAPPRMEAAMSEAMTPHAQFRWLSRKVNVSECLVRVEVVLQQAFTRAAGGGIVWIDVPTVDETGASQ